MRQGIDLSESERLEIVVSESERLEIVVSETVIGG